MSSKNFILAVVLSSTLFTLSSAQPKDDSSPSADLSGGESWVEWSALLPVDNLVLTVSGPQGLYLKQEQSRPRFEAIDEQGHPRPDGRYKWELIVQIAGGPSRVLSGWFEIQGGRIVRPEATKKPPASVEPGAPENSVYVDEEGRVGIGTLVPGAQLHLKGTDPALAIEDTQAGGREYRLRSRESGDGSLGLFDQTTGAARWLVDREGRVGINTVKPTSALTVDGYIESTKGFLVNGRPVGGFGFGLVGGNQPLSTETGSNNYFGTGAGASNINGSYNSFFGADAGHSNTSGNMNSFFGYYAGFSNTSGNYNSFFGDTAGAANTTGHSNSFFGEEAGYSNTSGNYNSFFGDRAGRTNTTGNYNSFFGLEAGYSNANGAYNSLFGRRAGYSNTAGNYNSFFGPSAGYSNTAGNYNSFFGPSAGYSNTTGTYNSFFGREAGFHNTVENSNTFVGSETDLQPGANPAANPVTNATAIGYRSYVAQSNSLILGSIANVNGAASYVNVGIGITAPQRQLHLRGPNAVFRMDRSANTASFILCRVDGSGNVWKSFVVGTDAYGVNNGEFIIMDTGTGAGGAGTRRMTIQNDGNALFSGSVAAAGFIQTSSMAFKANVRTYENALETVNRLRGVRFDWKDSGKAAVGLIAEEVQAVVPEVVEHEVKSDAPTGVNYASLVAVLVEAVKQQQKTIQEQQKANEEQQKAIERQGKVFLTTERQHQEELLRLRSRVDSLEGLLKRR